MNERKLTKSELAKREDIIMKMKKNKRALTQKYGKDAEAVMYGRATKLAKKQSESMDQDKIKELVKDALQNPKKADLNKDGKLSDYEKKRGAAIEKAMVKELDLDLKGGTEKDKDADIAGVVGAEDVLGLEEDLFEGASTEEKRIAMRAIKSIAKYRGVSEDEARQDLLRAAKELGDLKETQITEENIGLADIKEMGYEAGEAAFEKIKGKFKNKPDHQAYRKGFFQGFTDNASSYGLNEEILTENKQEAADELQMIMEQLYELSDQAKMIFRNNFPGEYRRLDAYGALDFGTSSNRYDVTLEGALENLDMEDDDEDMMQEDLDLGHQDNEPHMLKADLYRIGKYAMELYQILDQFEGGSEEVDLPHWWQSKIIKSKDAIVGAKHYLDFEIKEPQIDAMVDVAQDVEAIDEFDDKSMKAYGDAVKKAYGSTPQAMFTDYSNKELAAYLKNNPTDKKAASELHKRSQKLKDLSRTDVKEGVWSLGSAKSIKNIIGILDMALDIKDPQELMDLMDMHDKSMYNIVGDDVFHDDIDGAKRELAQNNLDRAYNRLIDAKGRAEDLLKIASENDLKDPSIFEGIAKKLAQHLKSK